VFPVCLNYWWFVFSPFAAIRIYLGIYWHNIFVNDVFLYSQCPCWCVFTFLLLPRHFMQNADRRPQACVVIVGRLSVGCCGRRLWPCCTHLCKLTSARLLRKGFPLLFNYELFKCQNKDIIWDLGNHQVIHWFGFKTNISEKWQHICDCELQHTSKPRLWITDCGVCVCWVAGSSSLTWPGLESGGGRGCTPVVHWLISAPQVKPAITHTHTHTHTHRRECYHQMTTIDTENFGWIFWTS